MLQIRPEQLAEIRVHTNPELVQWWVERLKNREESVVEPSEGWQQWVHQSLKACFLRGIHNSDEVYKYILEQVNRRHTL